MIETILKRDGREVPFDASKITYAIERALEATGGKPSEDSAEKLAEQVVCELEAGESVGVPTVEEIQDTVEKVLINGQELYPLSRRAQPGKGNEYPADEDLRRYHL